MTALETHNDQPPARPLKVLVPLIKEDLQLVANAGIEHKQACGLKLIEAKAQLKHGEWYGWLKRNFTLSVDTARHYMVLAEETRGQNPRTLGFSSLNEFHRKTDRPFREVRTKKDWHDGVKEDISRARKEAQRLAEQENISRMEEREAERKLGLRLIDIGFRVLSKELHPDKGGSREAMSRLGKVRDRLKSNV